MRSMCLWLLALGALAGCGAPRSVYLGSTDKSVYALLGKDGSLRWKSSLGGEVHVAPGEGGASLFVSADDGAVYAFDRDNASLRWRTQVVPTARLADLPPRAVLSTPITAAGLPVYVATSGGEIYALDPGSGAATMVSRLELVGQQWLALSRDAATLYATARRRDSGGPGAVYAVATAGGAQRWRTDVAAPLGPAAEGVNGGLWVAAGEVLLLATSDGHVVQRYRPRGGAATGVAADGAGWAFVGASTGAVEQLYVTSSGAIGSYWQASPVAAEPFRPVLDGAGRLFVGYASGDVTAFNAQSGAITWNVKVDSDLAAEPAVGTLDASGTAAIVVVSRGGHVRALSPANGALVWQQPNIVGGPLDAPSLMR